MTTPWENIDDFAWVVAMAAEPQTNPAQQVPTEAHATQQPTTPIQQHFAPKPVAPEPAPVPATEPAPVPATEPAPVPEPVLVAEPIKQFDLNQEIDDILKEFGIEDRPTEPKDDNQELSNKDDKTKESLAKNEKINIIINKLVSEKDDYKDKLMHTAYERDQYKLTADNMHTKISELIERNTALEYDENKLPVNKGIRPLVENLNAWQDKVAKQETPDTDLSERVLADTVRVIEAITKVSMDKYLAYCDAKNNPKIPKIWNNHSVVDYADPYDTKVKPEDKPIEERKKDPNWNPMETMF